MQVGKRLLTSCRTTRCRILLHFREAKIEFNFTGETEAGPSADFRQKSKFNDQGIAAFLLSAAIS
jgi:hypothetical protein